MSVDAKAFAQKILDAAAEQGITVALPEASKLLAGLFEIGKEAAEKGITKLSQKAHTTDPMADTAE